MAWTSAIAKGRRRKKCRHYAQASLTGATVKALAEKLGVFSEYAADEPEQALQSPTCEVKGTLQECGANVGGPAGNTWIFEGAGTSRHLIEFGTWAEES